MKNIDFIKEAELLFFFLHRKLRIMAMSSDFPNRFLNDLFAKLIFSAHKIQYSYFLITFFVTEFLLFEI